MMRLSEAVEDLPGRLLSDGEFHCLALATERKQTCFLTFLEREKFLPSLENPNISCVLTVPELAERLPPHIRGVFVCRNPKAVLFEVHNALASHEEYTGPSFPIKIGIDCNISPLAAIDQKNVVIGNRVVIESFAVIRGRVIIGNDVTVRAGAVIGCKGFSFSKNGAGDNIPVADTAQIVLKDRVEIFEQAAISTGIFPWEKTVIGENTKVDTQCFIAHGSHIGKNCLFAAGGRVCGNVRIGDNMWIDAAAVVSNRISVGNAARVSIGAVVTKDVGEGETVTGNFAVPHQIFMQNLKASLAEYTPGGQMPPRGGHFKRSRICEHVLRNLREEAA